MHTAIRAFLCGFVTLSLLWPAPAAATTINPLLFEELVFGADFVGVVECDQAGGVVAGYKVIESWKGAKAGDRITIRVAVNYWEPQFPIALCGERYFVTAYKQAPSTVVSTTSGGGVPLWWRDVPADYRLPLFQGRRLITAEEVKGAEFQKTRKRVQELLALKPAEREAALIKAVIEKDLFSDRWVGGEEDVDKVKELRAKFAKIADADALVTELLRLAGEDSKKWGVRVRIVLDKAGGSVTLARLEKLSAEKSPWEKDVLAELVADIKRRQSADVKPPRKGAAPPKNEVPGAEKLTKLRAALTEGEKSDDFGEAFDVLTRHDPAVVVEYLVAWKNPNADWRDTDRGYVFGSYFAWRCGKDHAKHLAALSGAKDPFIRVAGAVYLCYEDAEAGTVALKKLTALEGDAGVWAALTLARRGDKAAVSRALEVFRELPKEQKDKLGGMAGVPHRNLQKRVLVLLSNSAHAAAVPQPVLPEEEKQLDALLKWWKQYGEKVTPQDPWLKLLEKQKVD